MQKQKVKTQSFDMAFILDVSQSMGALDYGQKSRGDVAKEFIKNYIEEHKYARYALSIFAGDAVNVLPLTSDYNLFSTFLSGVDEKSILNGGSDFKNALDMTLLRFHDSPNGGAIVLISDFEVNTLNVDKQRILFSINQLKTQLKKQNIELILVGVGNKKGSKIPAGYDILGNKIYKKDKNNKEVITFFDETFFQSLDYQQYVIENISDISKIPFQNIPSNTIEIEISQKIDISWYTLMGAYISFLFYLGTMIYYDKKTL